MQRKEIISTSININIVLYTVMIEYTALKTKRCSSYLYIYARIRYDSFFSVVRSEQVEVSVSQSIMICT